MKLKNIILSIAIALFAFTSCSDDDKPVFPDQPANEYDMIGFAKGADVSWLTEMEKAGKKFYNSNGEEMECMALLRDLGFNSVRLRVWVDPADGWCNTSDMLVKAWRAKNLGMRIMVDFHYSDSWADPAQQTKPAAWADFSFEDLKKALADHTTETLTALKEMDITPEWVQIGNETMNGMLWEDGGLLENVKNYAELNNAGYDATKAIFPDAKVIIHFDRGHRNDMYRPRFDALKNNNAKWDVIGMSLYPTKDNWEMLVDDCYYNMLDMVERYGSDVMICEIGMDWDQAEASKSMLTALIEKTKAVPNEKGLGVFYWEPQSYGSWNGYTKGAFDESGKPTVALDAFK
ncbi:arabinogalactan endo-1,4-beta-galactosidase [Dysgonomonas sp. 521]|uniref:glycoside hydrolase family 53 protein n=1 Tax=Dysgonomonas sp. 521 TaxID=2302932 RepID=UPI0013D69667|nr:glycosyl hydrolase 53 family protein [Dysgonomonas sp. 521]NDV94274.1 arabinogalactan endo-1,4-beta-galactosidase [Dysgonomonas sp. 521]